MVVPLEPRPSRWLCHPGALISTPHLANSRFHGECLPESWPDSSSLAKRGFAPARQSEGRDQGMMPGFSARSSIVQWYLGATRSGGSRPVPGGPRSKADDLVSLKRAKRDLDPRLISEAAELVAALVQRLHGFRAADAVTCVPCGHSRRPDCLGKRIAQAVEGLGLPFLQVFADRPCSGVSHPKEFAKLPPLEQIADSVSSMLLVDDLATSGWHVEESLTVLRRLGAAASAFVWIGGTVA
jgi:hypothetical protein